MLTMSDLDIQSKGVIGTNRPYWLLAVRKNMTESLMNNLCKTSPSRFEEKDLIGNPSNSDKGNRKQCRQVYRQLYKKDWEENPLFKGWLSAVPSDKYKAVCLACKKELLAHRLTILKHASSAKHLNKLDLLKKTHFTDDDQRNESPGTMSSSNSTHSLPEQIDLEKVTVSTFSNSDKTTDTLISTDKEFSTDLVLTHQKTDDLFVNAVPVRTMPQELVEKTLESAGVSTDSVADNFNIFIQTETYVDISDSSEAINFKPGYVAKNSKSTILSSFLNAKLDDDVDDGVISKITTIPLQVSTRVTDYSRGVSVNNLNITLYKLSSGKWMSVSESMTDEVGRCNFFPKAETYFAIGCYKLHYDVATYYELQNLKSYFPFIEISFILRSPNESHHIPLMISPNGYTAYRSLDF